ncbi:MAG: SurA N-terminal domain-containing protein [Gammaproteobacteria bacterium]
MLQKLSDRIQGMVAWIIIGLVTITFTLFGLDYYLQSRHPADVKVKINGHVITKEDYELNYRRLSQTQGQDALTPEQEKELKQQVLSEMMVNAVSVAAARNHGFEVDGRQATDAILQIPQFQEDGHFSASRYTQALNNAFFTPQTFQQEVRQGMLLNQQRFALIGTEFVLPNELNQFVKLSMQTRDYQYTIIKAADFINKEQVSPEEEKQYYQAHQKQFMTKEQVSLDYIRLSLQSIKDKIKITPDQIARYYEDNKSNYLMPAQWQLAYVRFPISEEQQNDAEAVEKIKQIATKWYETVSEKPEQFDLIAKKTAKAKQAQLGELPTVIAGQSALDQYLINLTQPGQISAPIRTKQGYEVLQLKSYKPATIQALSEVKNLIAEQLQQEAAQQQYAALEDHLSELSYQNPDSLEAIASTLQVPLQHTGLFMQGHPNQQDPITQYPAVMQAAFSSDVLTYGNNSEPIQLDVDSLVVLRIRQHIPAALQDLTQVKAVIDSVLLKDKASLAAEKYGKSLAQRAAKKLPETLHWQHVNGVSRDSDVSDAQINELAFAMNEVGQYAGQELQNGDFVLVNLLKISDGKADLEDKEQMHNLTQQLESSYGLMDYDLYISHLMAQAKIVK